MSRFLSVRSGKVRTRQGLRQTRGGSVLSSGSWFRQGSNPRNRVREWSSCLAKYIVTSLMLALTSQASAERILLIGNSITWGVVSGSTPGVPYRIALQDLRPDDDVDSAALIGATARGWVAGPDWDAVVAPKLPADVCVFLLGTNDLLLRRTGAELVDDLAILAERCAPAESWVMVPPPRLVAAPGWKLTPAQIATFLIEYQAEIQEECTALEPAFECGPDLLEEIDPIWMADGVHPDATGHALIAQAVDLTLLPEPMGAHAWGIACVLALYWGRVARGRARRTRNNRRRRRRVEPFQQRKSEHLRE